MEKIIVADDEYFSRKALVKLLEKTGLAEVCYEAETGIEVLEYLKENTADIVLTDIKMPEMDGLQLAEHLMEKYPSIITIIVSGFSDFEYAKTAMKCGVREYLTKPVKKDELQEALQRTLGRIKEQREEENRSLREAALKYLKFSDVVIQPHLSRLVLGIENDAFSYQIVIFQTEKNGHMKKACEFIVQYDWEPISVNLFVHSQEIVVCLKAESESQLKKNELGCDKIIQMIGKINIALFAAGSGVCMGVGSLPQVYESLIDTMNERLTVNRCQYYSADKREKQVPPIIFSHLDTQAVYDGVLEYQYKRAWEPIERFLNLMHGSGQQNNLYSGLQKIFLSINQGCQNRAKVDSDQDMRKILFNLDSSYMYQFRSLDEIRIYIQEILDEVCRKSERNVSLVGQIKEYVEEHYQEEITLNVIAQEQFFMNPSYLSRIFKETTGMAFSKYLTEVRMTHAKSLLKNTRFRVNDIAGYVGYNDVSYFIQTFKKIMGLTPEQYRQEG